VRPLIGQIVIAAAAACLAIGPRVVAQPGEVIADAEAYAVYAAALQNPLHVERNTVERIALLDETRAGNLECAASVEPLAEWRPVVKSYRTENAHSRIIAPGPDFAVPYAIVTYDDLAGMMRQAGYDLSDLSQRRSNGIGVFQRLPGGRLIALSAVGFDRTKTRAMLALQDNCFPSQEPRVVRNRELCQRGGHVYFEKRGGRWLRTNVPSVCQWGT
jgi:hypothetical protein